MASIEELLRELEQEAHATRRVLERVPEDRLGWKPHEKSMTLCQLAMHVATLPGELAEISTRFPFPADAPIPRPQPASVAELFSALRRSVAKARLVRCSWRCRAPRFSERSC